MKKPTEHSLEDASKQITEHADAIRVLGKRVVPTSSKSAVD